MARPIKFRAWDKDRRLMLAWGVKANGEPRLEHLDHPVISRPLIHTSVDLMQFTGLLDKNGKEIYEGDIVEGNPLGWTSTMRGVVIWMNDGWFVDPEDDRDNEKRLHQQFFSKVEVVGNMFENANLMGYEG